MNRTLAIFYSVAWRAAIAFLTVEIVLVSSLRYFTNSQPGPEPVLANAHAHPFLFIHVLGGVIALLLGPLQFVTAVRDRWPRAHRISGRIYALACAIGAPAGLMLAIGTTAGPVASVGFAIPAILWPAFSALGVRAAIGGRFDEHREWMLRSYAITSTAITLRLMLPAAGLLGLSFFPAYRVIAWLAWMTNLALFEYYIRRKRGPAAPARLLAAA